LRPGRRERYSFFRGVNGHRRGEKMILNGVDRPDPLHSDPVEAAVVISRPLVKHLDELEVHEPLPGVLDRPA
jgi:hypothetical protein